MKKLFIASMMLAMSFTHVFAQNDSREPGLYIVNGEESTLMTTQTGSISSSSTGLLGIDLGKTKYNFKGATSGATSSGTFVMVINPEKKNVTMGLKKYDVFVSSVTPDNMIIVPLEVVKNKRVYEAGKSINGFNVSTKDSLPFEWEPLTDNSYTIKVDLTPGEYAIVFKATKHANFEFTRVFGFTVPEK